MEIKRTNVEMARHGRIRKERKNRGRKNAYVGWRPGNASRRGWTATSPVSFPTSYETRCNVKWCYGFRALLKRKREFHLSPPPWIKTWANQEEESLARRFFLPSYLRISILRNFTERILKFASRSSQFSLEFGRVSLDERVRKRKRKRFGIDDEKRKIKKKKNEEKGRREASRIPACPVYRVERG